MTFETRIRGMLLPVLLTAAALAATPACAQNPAAPAPPEASDTVGYELRDVVEHPELINRREVSRLLHDNYPAELRSRGEPGVVTIRMLIKRDGMVDSARVTMVHASNTAFVEPAANVARGMRFKPATVDSRPVAVWVILPIAFVR